MRNNQLWRLPDAIGWLAALRSLQTSGNHEALAPLEDASAAVAVYRGRVGRTRWSLNNHAVCGPVADRVLRVLLLCAHRMAAQTGLHLPLWLWRDILSRLVGTDFIRARERLALAPAPPSRKRRRGRRAAALACAAG